MRRAFFATLSTHALAWLTVANGIGVLLALLLLFPDAGRLLGPVTYGRLLPIHLDLQFYGWCTLPLLGLLFRFLGPKDDPGPLATAALAGWSATLAWTAVSLAAGASGGKTYLEWSGAARGVLAAGLALLAAGLLDAYRRRVAAGDGTAAAWVGRGVVAALLLPAPLLLYAATATRVYPPINPDSGGATHASTAASVLGVAAVLALFPLAAGRRPRDGGRVARRVLALLGLHLAAFAVFAGGDASHRDPMQLALLVSLLPWPFLLGVHLARFRLAAGSRRWLLALAGWSAPLFATGLVAGWPGGNERWKFTNALVGHVHLALAGVATAFLVLVLGELDRGARLALGRRRGFALWNAGLALHVGALLALGSFEVGSPQIVHRAGASPLVAGLFLARVLGGAAMLAASLGWLGEVLGLVRRRRPAPVPAGSRDEPAEVLAT